VSITFELSRKGDHVTEYQAGMSIYSKEIERDWSMAQDSPSIHCSTSIRNSPVLIDTLSPTLRLVDDLVTRLSALEDDWDGDEAVAPTSYVVNNMRLLVNHLDRAAHHQKIDVDEPHCFATPTGGIELFWRSQKFFLSLLIEPSLPGRVIVIDGDGVTPSETQRMSCADAATYAVRRLCKRSGR